MAKIEDFGEKIGGARKDLYGLNRELRLGDIVDWSDIDRDKYITKKEVFPLPDYQKLYDQGMDREVLFFVKQVRDALPAKPSPVIRYSMADEEKQKAVRQAQEDYVQTVGRFYDKAIHLKSLTECADYLNSLRTENLPDQNCFNRKVYNAASIKDSYSLLRFRHQLEKKKFLYSDDEKALLNYEIFSYNGSNVEVEMDRNNEPVLVIKQGGARFFVYRNSPEILDLSAWKENTYFVMDKTSHTIVTMNEPDRSSAEQTAIALHKQKDVTVKERKKRKQKLTPPQLENIRPTQENYRNGSNITGDDMMEVFGFRAGEFGNWENDNDRQTNLNMSYDALKDLAKSLNMREQDISLGGKLAIAYGARGVSGALAHFEPGTNVINLTKMRGAGSLAHEWGHALDYYIAQTTGKGEIFATDTWDGMSYMHEVMQAIHYKEDGTRTEYYKNAVLLDENYSKAGQGYWKSDAELFARAFAAYVRDRLPGDSDYLAGHSEMMAPIYKGEEQQWIYTSPQGEERKRINQAMDEMIDAVKEQGLLHQGRNRDVNGQVFNQDIEENQNKVAELNEGQKITPSKMTLDEYLGSQGVGYPTSGYVLDKVRFPHGISKSMRRQIDAEFEKVEGEYAERRAKARNEYEEKVKNGEIVPKTQEEITIEKAQGDPLKESTQAARRMIVKRGLMTEEELNSKISAWDEKWTAQESEKTFAEQVDDVLAGNTDQYNALKVCDTPQLLMDAGCEQLPMLFTQKHLRDAIHPLSQNNSKWHGLTVQQIKKLPELIENPVMIYDSQTQKNSIIVVTSEIDTSSFPVIVSIKANGIGTYELQKIDSNFITSVYGRRNFTGHITDVVNNGDLLYWDKEKSQKLFRVSRLQLPGCLNNLDSGRIIHQSRSFVNEIKINGLVDDTNEKSQKIFERWGEQYSELTNTFDFDTILHPGENIVKRNTEKQNNVERVTHPASAKQKKYAQQIAQTLHVDLPQNDTKQAYMEFIKEHVEEYNQNKKVPVHYTDEQIARANAVDIVEYAKSQGLELKRAGRDYRVSNYSGGFLITPEKNNWNWFAENKGGGVVQLCMELENKTWQDAIGTLIQEDMVAIQRPVLQNRQPEKPKEFHLPDRNNTTKHVYAYLTKTRKIDADIVKQMLGRKLLYENVQRSCVFVGYDKEGIPRHASVRSTNTTGNVYKKDVSGSQKKYSFSVTGKTNVLNVFEAPIDAMSYMSLQKINGIKPQDSYVALGGVSMTALDQYVKDHPEIRVIRICTDNDEAGQRAAEHIAEKYKEQYKVTRHTPKAKDFNEDLIDVNKMFQSVARSDMEEKTYSDPNAEKYHGFVEQHKQLIQDKRELYQNRTTIVINAFGGAGAGKTVACMDVCQQLKKRGYNAEYVSEYCKELVYENSDLLSGMPDNQFDILKEQMRRMDRMIGQVDFIVTDSPILLNSVYNKELTPEYAKMVQELFHDYDNFTFFVERDTSHYQTEGRIHTLAESIEKDRQIKQMLRDNDIYYGRYNHNTIEKIVDNAEKTFRRLQQRDRQLIDPVNQEAAVTSEEEIQSLSIEEKIQYLSVLDTVYEENSWKLIEQDIKDLSEAEKAAYRGQYEQKRDECRLDKALVPKVGIAAALEDGTFALQSVKVVDERLADMIKTNPEQIDIEKMSVNGKEGDLLLLKDSILEPYELYRIGEAGLIKIEPEDQKSVERCRQNISEQMLSSSFDVEMEQQCVKPLIEDGVTLSSEIQKHYQKITQHFELQVLTKGNPAAPEKKKELSFRIE